MKIEEIMKKINENLTSLMDGKAKEEIDKIANVGNDLTSLQEEIKKKDDELYELRKDYVDLVKKSSFKGEGKEEIDNVERPKTWEECIQEVLKEKN